VQSSPTGTLRRFPGRVFSRQRSEGTGPLKISTKLYAGFAMVILLAVVLGFFTVRGIESMSGVANDAFEYPLTSGSFARSAQNKFLRLELADREVLPGAGAMAAAELDSQIRGDLDIVVERLRHDEAPKLVAEIRTALDKLKPPRGTPTDQLPAGAGAIETLGEQRRDLFSGTHGKFERLVDLTVEAGYDFLHAAEDRAAGIYETQLAAVAALIAVAIVIAGLLAGGTARPLAAVALAATRLSRGDREVAIPVRARRDEIGAMAGAFELLRDKLAEVERLNAEGEALRGEMDNRVRERMVALTRELDAEVQEAVRFASDTSSDMRETADDMQRVSARVSEQALSAAQSASSASENVGEIAASAERLARSIADIANGVTRSGEELGRAQTEAEATRATVQRLSEAAQRMGEIVRVITGIATQANLLALDATVEASRAGAVGSGFAAVAHDVKNFANQTTSATEEIDRRIGAIQQEIDLSVTAILGICGTVGTVNETGQAITAAVARQCRVTDEISRDAQLTASETEAVSSAIREIAGEALAAAELSETVRAAASEIVERVGGMQTDLALKLSRHFG
jgi:methyl-accepting chemotaxis protein